jgi:oxygen-independent coproporphyrinogen III oxidase
MKPISIEICVNKEIMKNQTQQLIQKYNVPAPRYTSYPTVPLWSNDVNQKSWFDLLKKAYQQFGDEEGIHLYIHLPFCESLCTYCGCNKRITKNHEVEIPYVNAVMAEWELNLSHLPIKPKIAGVHLGGGTPTFFSPESLKLMLTYILENSTVMPGAEMSFEGHPNNTTYAHLQTLFDLGFRRVSYGIQDFDIDVQKAIHRIQPFEKVQEATENARKIGYEAVNFDLIYGLPHQTIDTITDTFEKAAALKPDRIAFYSYAHLPSVFPAQKSFEQFLPNENIKRKLYEKGKNILQGMGYEQVGMDHFALPEDPLFQAKLHKKLHRNFMGYTEKPSKILIGLGNSAISDIYFAYAQNAKDIDLYKECIQNGQLSLSKGHIMSAEDIHIRKTILDLSCNQTATLDTDFWAFNHPELFAKIKAFESEGIVNWQGNLLTITPLGMPFVRNVCMEFDLRMKNRNEEKFLFSRAI